MIYIWLSVTGFRLENLRNLFIRSLNDFEMFETIEARDSKE